MSKALKSSKGNKQKASAAKKATRPVISTRRRIGQSYGGGIVFYVYDGGQHGLIAATEDQNDNLPWNAGINTITVAWSDGVGAGKSNTDLIIAYQGPGPGDGVDGTYAARMANEHAGGDFGDWYLPSSWELNLLYTHKNAVGGFTDANYWSSLEHSQDESWYQNFADGSQHFQDKSLLGCVRAIRAF